MALSLAQILAQNKANKSQPIAPASVKAGVSLADIAKTNKEKSQPLITTQQTKKQSLWDFISEWVKKIPDLIVSWEKKLADIGKKVELFWTETPWKKYTTSEKVWWGIIKAVWTFLQSPQELNNKIADIATKVWEWKLTQKEWIFQSVLNVWTTALWTYYAPVQIALNTALNSTWTSESYSNLIKSWTDNSSKFLQGTFGISKEKADSYVDDLYNVASIWAWIKWGITMWKWLSSFKTAPIKSSLKISQWVLEQSVPDITMALIWLASQKEWKIPNQEDIKNWLKWLWVISIAWAIPWIPIKWKTKLKEELPPQTDITDIIPETKTLEQQKILQDQVIAEKISPSKTTWTIDIKAFQEFRKTNPTATPSDFIKSTKVEPIVKIETPIKMEEKVLSNLKKEPTEIKESIAMDKENIVDIKKTETIYSKNDVNPYYFTKDWVRHEKTWDKFLIWDTIPLEKFKEINTQSKLPNWKPEDAMIVWLAKENYKTISVPSELVKSQLWEKIDQDKADFYRQFTYDEIPPSPFWRIKDWKIDIATGTHRNFIMNEKQPWNVKISVPESKISDIEKLVNEYNKQKQPEIVIEPTKTVQPSKTKKQKTKLAIKDGKVVSTKVDIEPKIKKEPITSEEWPFWPVEPKKDITIKYNPDEFKWVESRVNVVTKLLRKAKLWRVAEGTWFKTIWATLNDIIVYFKEWTKRVGQPLWDLVSGIQTTWREIIRKSVRNKLWVDKMRDIVNKNWEAIDTGYKFVKDNLEKLFPWKDLDSRMIRKNIKMTEFDNTLYQRDVWTKWINDSRMAVLNTAVEKLARQEIESKWWLDNPDIWLMSDTDIQLAFDNAIAKMPESVQPMLKEIWTKFNPYTDTWLQWAFRELWGELQDAKILKFIKDKYIHWYVNRELFDKFQKETWTGNEYRDYIKNHNLEDTDIMQILSDVVSPEQRAKILKHSQDIWQIHSWDPLTIMESYAWEIAKLVSEKKVNDIMNESANANPQVKIILDEQRTARWWQVIKKIMWVWERKSLPWRIANKTLSLLGISQLYGSTILSIQNALSSWMATFWNIASLVFQWEFNLLNLPKWTYNDMFTFLHNSWQLANKARNVDNTISGKWSILAKTGSVLKQYVIKKPLEFFVALWEVQWQIASVAPYMNSFVKKHWWLKVWETLPVWFTRILDWLDGKQKALVEAKVSYLTKNINDVTALWGTGNNFFDSRYFGMFKFFWRGKLSRIWTAVKDTVDTIYDKIKNENVDRQWRVWWNTAEILWSTIWMAITVKIIADMFTDNEDEKKEIERRVYASSVWEWFKNMSQANLSPTGYSLLVDLLVSLWQTWFEVVNWDATAEWVSKRIIKLFWAIDRTLTDSWLKWEWKVYTMRGNLKYRANEFSNMWTRILWISRGRAEYQVLNKKLDEVDKAYKSWDKFVIPIVNDVIDSINLTIKDITWFTDTLKRNAFIQQTKIINSNINTLDSVKLSPEQWVDWIFKWVKWVDSENYAIYKENLSKWYASDIRTNLWIIANLQKELENIAKVNQVPIYKDDFSRTIRELNEKQPQQYVNFISKLYNFVADPSGKTSFTANQQVFVKNIIADELGWKRLWSAVATKIESIMSWSAKWEIERGGKYYDDYEQLKVLDSLISLAKEKPSLYQELKDSFPWIVNTTITIKNAKLINDAIKELPNIRELYEQEAVLRWAVLKWEETIQEAQWRSLGDIVDSIKTSTPTPTPTQTTPTLQSFITNKSQWTQWLLLPEKQTPKLADLIKVQKYQPQPLTSQVGKQNTMSLREIVERTKSQRN